MKINYYLNCLFDNIISLYNELKYFNGYYLSKEIVIYIFIL